jgi:threonine/homoserine/homoserine lactone efflux protein
MNIDTLLAATLFAFVSSITPGPNNTMLLASGVNFGFRRSLRHLAGVQIGFWILLLATGLGLNTALALFPGFYQVLRAGGAAYLLWMAWKLATAHTASTDTSAPSQPMGFWAAVAFQWVNPKAWVMTVTCMTTYLPPDAGTGQMLTLIAMFVVVGVPCSLFWLSFGQAMRQWLQDPLRLRVFNLTMAVALVASLYPMLSA